MEAFVLQANEDRGHRKKASRGILKRMFAVSTAALICTQLAGRARAQTVTYSYDAAGRLTAVVDPSGNAAVYNYL